MIFANSQNKNARIGEVGSWVEGRWVWKLEWRREWFNWEESILQRFMEEHNNVGLEQNEKDVLVWTQCPSRTFSASNA